MNAPLQMPALLRFACDSVPNCGGQIVDRIGDFVILEGMAADSGAWFTKGPGGPRRHNTRQEAVDYIEYAQDDTDPILNKLQAEYDDLKSPAAKRRLEEYKKAEREHQAGLAKEKEAQKRKERGDSAEDEPIAADPEEVKKAWKEASAAAQKRHPDYNSGNYKSRGRDSGDAEDCEGMDSEERELLYEPEAKAAAQREKDAKRKPAKDDVDLEGSEKRFNAQSTREQQKLDASAKRMNKKVDESAERFNARKPSGTR